MFFHISLLLVHIERSKKIHSILSQLHTVTNQPISIQNMDLIAKLLQDIEPFDVTNDIITTAATMHKKFQQASHYASEIEQSRDLTSQQLVIAMTLLQEYEHLLPQASECIAQATSRYEQIKQEYVKYIPSLIEALEQDIATDGVTFNLSQVLMTFDLSLLRSAECKEFYKCCSLFVKAVQLMAEEKFDAVEEDIQV